MGQRGRRHFGSVRRLPSGRFQASYWNEGIRHVGEDTFPTKTDALAYLSTVETDLRRGTWIDPEAGRKMFADLADGWLVSNPAKRSSTMQRDEAIVRNHLLPALESAAVGSITRVRIQDLVNVWATDRGSEDGSPSVRRSQGDLRLRGRNRCPAAVTMSWCQAASGRGSRSTLAHARRRIENRRRHAGDVPPDGLDRRCARTALGRGRRLAGQSAGLRSRNDHGGHSASSRRSD